MFFKSWHIMYTVTLCSSVHTLIESLTHTYTIQCSPAASNTCNTAVLNTDVVNGYSAVKHSHGKLVVSWEIQGCHTAVTVKDTFWPLHKGQSFNQDTMFKRTTTKAGIKSMAGCCFLICARISLLKHKELRGLTAIEQWSQYMATPILCYLGRGTIVVVLSHTGITAVDKERFKILMRNSSSWSAHTWSTHPGTPSGPAAFLTQKPFWPPHNPETGCVVGVFVPRIILR